METITLDQVIKLMDSGATFSIGFRTYNRRDKKGGEYIFVSEAVKHNHATREERLSRSIGVKPATVGVQKNPNHYENSTRNIKVIANGNLIKIHLRLITDFNNQKVL